MSASQPSPVAREVLEGSRRVKLLAAEGLLPIAPSDLVPLQVQLALGIDEEVAEKAAKALAEMDPKILVPLVEEGVTEEVIIYLGSNPQHPTVVEAILRARTIPPALLGDMAPRLAPEMQELLLLRQDLIIEFPQILDELEKNEQSTAYTKRRINEYREHLLPREKRPRKTRAEYEEEAEAITEEELEEAVEEVKGAIEAEGDEEDVFGLSESQVRQLPIPVRLKLTRGASKSLRSILIKDRNPMVAVSVLHNNAMNELEVEHIANNRAIISEVLEVIGSSRTYTRKYSVVAALVKNPRTPAGMANRFVPRLSIRDLQSLSKDRNVSNTVRDTAKRLYRMKRK